MASKTFTMHLHGANRYERLDNVESFVGEDPSGRFGILAHHARMITFLNFGLARFRYASGEEEYLALPGGILYFTGNELRINTRNFMRSKNYEEIVSKLEHEFRAEEKDLKSIKDSVHLLEEEVFRRLWEMKRTGEP